MPVNNEKFDQLKIDKLKHFLEDMCAKGQPRPYEIFVDGLKVIPKTEDPKDFDSYEYYMNEDTEKIRILIYNTNLSPRNDQYNFFVQSNKHVNAANGLGEIDNIIQEKLSARDKEYEMTKLKEENDDLRMKISQAEEYEMMLKDKIEELEAGKLKINGTHVGEIASVFLSSLVKKNPQMLSRFPGGDTLAGMLAPDNEEKPAGAPEGEATFQKKADAESSMTEEQKRHAALLAHLEEKLSEPQLDDIMLILRTLAEQPERLEEIKQFLHIQNQSS